MTKKQEIVIDSVVVTKLGSYPFRCKGAYMFSIELNVKQMAEIDTAFNHLTVEDLHEFLDSHIGAGLWWWVPSDEGE